MTTDQLINLLVTVTLIEMMIAIGLGVTFAELTAVAGTHLVARDESAAAIGNVYVRRDRRGQGLGRLVTAAVINDLRDLETIGLNVREDNAAAIRVYESLGFVKHCDFREALALRPAG